MSKSRKATGLVQMSKYSYPELRKTGCNDQYEPNLS